MERNDFYNKQRHYYFGEKQPEKSVERKDSIEPDGRHKIELTLAFDSEEAQRAVVRFIGDINGLHEVREVGELTARVNWLNGYIAALYAAGVIDEEQAQQLADLLGIASKQQARLLGVTKWNEKGW